MGAQEGAYFSVKPNSLQPPYQEYEHNPIWPTASPGYENCEFFMGPKGEAGYVKGLLHIVCNWHSKNKGNPHLVTAPNTTALEWTFVETLHIGAAEPTPVYEGVP